MLAHQDITPILFQPNLVVIHLGLSRSGGDLISPPSFLFRCRLHPWFGTQQNILQSDKLENHFSRPAEEPTSTILLAKGGDKLFQNLPCGIKVSTVDTLYGELGNEFFVHVVVGKLYLEV